MGVNTENWRVHRKLYREVSGTHSVITTIIRDVQVEIYAGACFSYARRHPYMRVYSSKEAKYGNKLDVLHSR